MDFCHLHVHSDYSLLDGAAKVNDLARTAAEKGLSSIALTDHGNMCGAIAFYKACQKHGVKPIIGCETYMAPGPRTDRRRDPVTGASSFHLTLLARNLTGYRNLMELVSSGYTEGFYYNPRIDKDLLRKHSDGLLVMSGCLSGETAFHLRKGNKPKAYETAEWYRDVFGDNYFIELMRNGAEGQEENTAELIQLARDLKLPLVCSNDVHYIEREDALAQEIRIAISTGKTITDDKRLRHSSREYFLKGGAEMMEIFKDLPETVHNTLEIASRCDVTFEFGKHHLPRFDAPEGKTADAYFEELCNKGLRERYGAVPPAKAHERLAYEMEVIRKMGFVSYFLITWDFIAYARSRDIPVGPGRGSAAGSIVSYCLYITNVDPLKYDLLFERFLNSERVSMPDIDIDFCRDGRAEVIEYVTQKYGGSERVSQIVTFGTMAARAVIRDVGRALDIPLSDIDVIAKKIPNGPGATLQDAIDADPELQELKTDSRYTQLFDVGLRLEGMNRHCSTHAAGVVVADAPLKNYVPVQKAGDDIVTQYTMDYLEDMGLLKMDFLGLKTLTVLDKALATIESNHGRRVDLDDLPPADEKTWSMLQRGEALGIFQLESGGMRELLRKLQPDRFEDLVAILALYRPGPLQTGMVDQFVDRKHGREEVRYLHPGLEPLLKDTYGTFVYQEQIMLIAHLFAGFTMNEADGLRKAMGKKKLEVMLKYKEQFVAGCVANDCSQEIATAIWEVMEQFAKYAFNKSHTCAYAVVTYQTAYLKANYPAEFMAALMSCDMGNTDKVILYIDECKRLGLRVLPPHVNRSVSDFSVEDEGEERVIRFGLAAVKGVGTGVVEGIVAARREGGEFDSLVDVAERVDSQLLNRATVEALVRGGALDCLGGHRAQLFVAIDSSLRAGAAQQEDKRAGQMSLFGAPASGAPIERPKSQLPEVPVWAETEVLAGEKEALGFYMSSHPLAKHELTLRSFSTATTRTLNSLGGGRTSVLLGGMISSLKAMYPKSGRNQHRKMARLRMEDFDGAVGCVLFSDQFERYESDLTVEAIGFVEGTVDLTRDEPDIRVERWIPVEKAFEELAGTLVIQPPEGAEERSVRLVGELLQAHPGKQGVLVVLSPIAGVKAVYRVKGGIHAGPEVHRKAAEALGAASVRWKTRSPSG